MDEKKDELKDAGAKPVPHDTALVIQDVIHGHATVFIGAAGAKLTTAPAEEKKNG